MSHDVEVKCEKPDVFISGILLAKLQAMVLLK